MKWIPVLIAVSLALAIPFVPNTPGEGAEIFGQSTAGGVAQQESTESNGWTEPVYIDTEYGSIPIYPSEPEETPEGPYAVASGDAEPLVLGVEPGTPAPSSHSTLPIEMWSGHLGPGSPLYISFAGGGSFICTANWLWKDHEGTLYLGSAGHCFLGSGDIAGDNSPGGNADLAIVSVQACIEFCAFGGNSNSAGINSITGTFIDLGAVKYARQNDGTGAGPGWDFGLVEIPPAYHSVATPQMLVVQEGFGGPHGQDDVIEQGEVVYLHGHGTWHGETFLTQNRPGTGLSSDGLVWEAALSVSGGDSGSALGSYEAPDQLYAAGIVTHSMTVDAVIGATPVPPTGLLGLGLGVGIGTVMSQAVDMVGEIGLCIEPLMMGDDPATSPPPAQDLSICPDGGATVSQLNITSPLDDEVIPEGITTITGNLTQITQPGPLVAIAGGPYSGDIDTDVPIDAIIAGGLPPYTCQWQTSGGLTVSSDTCSATVRSSSATQHTLDLLVEDSLGTAVQDQTTVTLVNPAVACIADAADDGIAPESDIVSVCVERMGSFIKVTTTLASHVSNPGGVEMYSPIVLHLQFAGANWLETYSCLGDSGIFDFDASRYLNGETVEYDTLAGTITATIPTSELTAAGMTSAELYVRSMPAEGCVFGGVIGFDRAPDAGTVGPVSAPMPSSPVSNHPPTYPNATGGSDHVEVYFDGVFVGTTDVDLSSFPVDWSVDADLQFGGDFGEIHAQWFMADGTFVAEDTIMVERMEPLVAFANGPYDGMEDQPTAISGSATGGPDATTRCTWSGFGAAFADANQCSTTVTFEEMGEYDITLTVKKGAFSAVDTALVHVELDPDQVEVGDADGDGHRDDEDNCFDVANKSQSDLDGDGYGDACDPDDDGDGKYDDVDNCPTISNEGQADLDGDGEGDACDDDWDGDGWTNGSDACPVDYDPNQADKDRDGIGDACDSDRDGDGYANAQDTYPDDKDNWSDVDLDGIPDQTGDSDDDGDGIGDEFEETEGTQGIDPNSRPPGDAGIEDAPSEDSPGLPVLALLGAIAFLAYRRK